METTRVSAPIGPSGRLAEADKSLGKRCRVCGDDRTAEFFRADDVPVFCNVAFTTRQGALNATRGNIRLRMCRECGYVYNAAFAPELVKYEPGYENALHFSPRFRQYARQLAGQLVGRLDLHGKRIIEIGCGDGYFLSLLCEMGPNTGVGFDPSQRPGDAFAGASGRVSFRREPYGPAHADEDADLICCRQVLEHIPDPLGFLRQLRQTVGRRDQVRLFFEVPNALMTLRGSALWDVLYEHCSYFVAPALRRLFAGAGFQPLSARQTYRGQFLALFAQPAPRRPVTTSTGPAFGNGMQACFETFADRFRGKLGYWQEYLRKQRKANRYVVFWGAGTKGVTLLNALEQSGRLVPHIVDISPRKQGKFIPGPAQEIVAPEFLRKHRPDAVVIMNPIYTKEIRRILQRLGIDAELLVA